MIPTLIAPQLQNLLGDGWRIDGVSLVGPSGNGYMMIGARPELTDAESLTLMETQALMMIFIEQARSGLGSGTYLDEWKAIANACRTLIGERSVARFFERFGSEIREFAKSISANIDQYATRMPRWIVVSHELEPWLIEVNMCDNDSIGIDVCGPAARSMACFIVPRNEMTHKTLRHHLEMCYESIRAVQKCRRAGH